MGTLKEISKDLKDFETIILQYKDHLLGQIYKLLIQYDTEEEQVKPCMVKWMQNIKGDIPLQCWGNLWTKKMLGKPMDKFTAWQLLKEN